MPDTKEPSYDLKKRGPRDYVIKPKPGVTRPNALSGFFGALADAWNKKTDQSPDEQS